jgi:hypothetical protein
MSTADTVISLLSMPWLSYGGIRLSTTPLPGSHPDVIQGLDPVYPGILSPEIKRRFPSCRDLVPLKLRPHRRVNLVSVMNRATTAQYDRARLSGGASLVDMGILGLGGRIRIASLT